MTSQPQWYLTAVLLNIWLALQLSRPAQLNAYVQPVTLPDENTPAVKGAVCTVSGWGVTQVYSYTLSTVLRAVDVREISYCKWYYWGRITENMMCAGSPYGGKDSCQVTNANKIAEIQHLLLRIIITSISNDIFLLLVHGKHFKNMLT